MFNYHFIFLFILFIIIVLRLVSIVTNALNATLFFANAINILAMYTNNVMPRETTVAFCLMQFFAQLPQQLTCHVDGKMAKKCLDVFYYFSIISGSFWSTIIACDMRRTFEKSTNQRRNSEQGQRKVRYLYFTANVVLSLIFCSFYFVNNNDSNSNDAANNTKHCFVLTESGNCTLCPMSFVLPLASVTFLNFLLLADCCVRIVCHRRRQPGLHKFRIHYMTLYGPIVLITAVRNISTIFVYYEGSEVNIGLYLLFDTLLAFHMLLGFICARKSFRNFRKLYKENNLRLNYSYSRYAKKARKKNYLSESEKLSALNKFHDDNNDNTPKEILEMKTRLEEEEE